MHNLQINLIPFFREEVVDRNKAEISHLRVVSRRYFSSSVASIIALSTNSVRYSELSRIHIEMRVEPASFFKITYGKATALFYLALVSLYRYTP